jgi:hypothetical protein
VPQAPQFCGLVSTSTQALPFRELQLSWPAAQPVSHWPATQAWPRGQAAPQAPQLNGFVARSAHWPLQVVCPDGQVQTPPRQLAEDPHRWAQPPQLNGSLVTSTQAALQSVWVTPQVDAHPPLEQTSLGRQCVAQAPQLVGSLWVAVQTPRQRWPAFGQAHCPA